MGAPGSLPFASHAPHLISAHHSAMAAEQAVSARARKSAAYLELVEHAGVAGLTDHETVAATGWPMSSVCSIRNGVRELLWPADREAISPYGRSVTCWRKATEDEVDINRQRAAVQQTLTEREYR